MKISHLSISPAATALVVTLVFCSPSLMAQQIRSLFPVSRSAETIFRGQSLDGGSVPMPVNPGESAPFQGTEQGFAGSSLQGAVPDFCGSQVTNYPMNSNACCGTDLSVAMFQGDTTWNAFSPQFTPDPFMTQPGYGVQPGYGMPPGYGAPGGFGAQPGFGMQPSPYAPYSPYGATPPGIPPQGLSAFGANGARPYRYGWSNAIDVSWLPGGDISAPPAGATGDMEIFGVDYRLGYTTPFVPGWILNWTNQFGYRNWDGPQGGISLPSDVFRFGMDFELETSQPGPVSISLGINPSFNTDFDASGSEGFQLDGRGILFMQLDQYWTLGLGAMYWDRVDDIIIPYAGLIYRDDYWEWQLMFPEARVSLFLGNEAMWSKWLYVRGEYHVESYGVERTYAAVTADDKIQLEDYRILIGMKMDSGYYSWFFEGGWVLDRSVEFKNSTVPGYDLKDGFIGQIGLRY